MLDKIKVQLKLFFSNMTYSKLVLIAVVVVTFLLVVRALFFPSDTGQGRFPGTPLNEVEVGQPASYEVTRPIDPATGQPVAEERQILTIYADDPSKLSPVQTEQLIQVALKNANLSRAQAYIVINPVDSLSDIAEFPADSDEYVDPTDPTTFTGYGKDLKYNRTFDAEELTNGTYTFSQWAEQTRPSNLDYAVYKESEYAYIVILKYGYTKADFERDVLSQFENTDELVFEYQNQEDNWIKYP